MCTTNQSTNCPQPLDFCPIVCHTKSMINQTSNPYALQILAKGRDLPTAQPSTRQIPARFADRFDTFEEYEEAMADFLNGM